MALATASQKDDPHPSPLPSWERGLTFRQAAILSPSKGGDSVILNLIQNLSLEWDPRSDPSALVGMTRRRAGTFFPLSLDGRGI